LRLANLAFAGVYDEATIRRWLTVFIRRFFSQQFKRSCLPDGPKVGSVTLSPRGDWRMPAMRSPISGWPTWKRPGAIIHKRPCRNCQRSKPSARVWNHFLLQAQLRAIVAWTPGIFINWAGQSAEALDASVTAIRRRGKYLCFELDSGLMLVVHLG
jgi:hypothetical protein